MIRSEGFERALQYRHTRNEEPSPLRWWCDTITADGAVELAAVWIFHTMWLEHKLSVARR